MQTTKYQSKTILVDEVEVTEDNMEEVAEWCGGTIVREGGGPAGAYPYIDVPVHNPVNKKQRMARIGDHVLHEPVRDTFKVYTPKAFAGGFEPVFRDEREVVNIFNGPLTDSENEEMDQLALEEGERPDVNYRDSITGEYVTKEYALANPDTTVKETEWETPRAGGSVHNPFEVSTGHEEVTDDGDSTGDDAGGS